MFISKLGFLALDSWFLIPGLDAWKKDSWFSFFKCFIVFYCLSLTFRRFSLFIIFPSKIDMVLLTFHRFPLISWVWIPGFGFLDLHSWVWSPGLGVLSLDSWIWTPGLNLTRRCLNLLLFHPNCKFWGTPTPKMGPITGGRQAGDPFLFTSPS